MDDTCRISTFHDLKYPITSKSRVFPRTPPNVPRRILRNTSNSCQNLFNHSFELKITISFGRWPDTTLCSKSLIGTFTPATLLSSFGRVASPGAGGWMSFSCTSTDIAPRGMVLLEDCRFGSAICQYICLKHKLLRLTLLEDICELQFGDESRVLFNHRSAVCPIVIAKHFVVACHYCSVVVAS